MYDTFTKLKKEYTIVTDNIKTIGFLNVNYDDWEDDSTEFNDYLNNNKIEVC